MLSLTFSCNKCQEHACNPCLLAEPASTALLPLPALTTKYKTFLKNQHKLAACLTVCKLDDGHHNSDGKDLVQPSTAVFPQGGIVNDAEDADTLHR